MLPTRFVLSVSEYKPGDIVALHSHHGVEAGYVLEGEKSLALNGETGFQLQKALTEVKILRGILPTCSYCKDVRDEAGNWHQLEAFIQENSEAKFSHGICPDCCKLHFPDFMRDKTGA